MQARRTSAFTDAAADQVLFTLCGHVHGMMVIRPGSFYPRPLKLHLLLFIPSSLSSSNPVEPPYFSRLPFFLLRSEALPLDVGEYNSRLMAYTYTSIYAVMALLTHYTLSLTVACRNNTASISSRVISLVRLNRHLSFVVSALHFLSTERRTIYRAPFLLSQRF